MAATVASLYTEDTPVNDATEILTVDFNGSATAAITPAKIKAIDFVDITQTNAAAADGVRVTSFLPGSATVTLTAVTNTSTCLVKLHGKIA